MNEKHLIKKGVVMALISRNDLHYEDYDWNADPTEDPEFHGFVNDADFDRKSGDHVLHVINKFARENDIKDKKRALELERKIHQNMAEDISTQRDVTEWLKSVFR